MSTVENILSTEEQTVELSEQQTPPSNDTSMDVQLASDESSEIAEGKNNESGMDFVPMKYATFFEAVMNSLNSVLGAGILSVPNSFISVGLVPSVILICMMACSYDN